MELTLHQRWAVTALLGLVTAGTLAAGYRAHVAANRAGPRPQAAEGRAPDGHGLRGGTGAEGAPGGAGGTASPGRALPDPAQPGLPPAEAGAPDAGTRTPPGQNTLVVHVAGAVTSPGVYRLPPEARVEDAVRAAGPRADAVPDALNLAGRLSDGEKIFVPSRADLAPGAQPDPRAAGASHSPGTGAPGAQPARPAGPRGRAGPVNVNTATASELTSVPGIGPVLAERIVERRRAVGRFRTLDDLLEVPGIGSARLEQLRRHLSL